MCAAHMCAKEQIAEISTQVSGWDRLLNYCDLRMVVKCGAVFWGSMQMSVTEDATYGPVYLMLLSDISERKQAEA